MLAAGVAAYALLQSLVVPVLPTLQADLHTTQNTVTWVLTAYLLSASIFTPIMGRVGDMVGKERMFVATLVALAVGLAARRAGDEHRCHDRRPGDPGHRRRRAAAGVRHHPRRVPQAQGHRRGRPDRLARRGRRRRRHRAGRADRRRAGLPLAVLAPDDPDDVAAVAAHFFVPESPVRTTGGSAGCRPCCCRPGWSRCWSR